MSKLTRLQKNRRRLVYKKIHSNRRLFKMLMWAEKAYDIVAPLEEEFHCPHTKKIQIRALNKFMAPTRNPTGYTKQNNSCKH